VHPLLKNNLVKATYNLVNENVKIAAAFSFTNVRLPQNFLLKFFAMTEELEMK